MKTFFLQFFTWWSGQTLGTRFHTWRHGELVGEDQFGNLYYRTRGGVVDPAIGIVRRWVVYAGATEATNVPPGWHAWLRHTADVPPSKENYVPREWQKEHRPNMTGTPYAYRPKGSIMSQAPRQPATGDYEPWTPGN